MNKLVVVKIGGNIIDDDEKLAAFLETFARIDGPKILVHGGGKLATRMAEDLGIRQEMVDGRRITDKDTLKIVTMVYAGTINKTIVSGLQAAGCAALGLTGADGNALLAHKRVSAGTDYGFVGDIDRVNTDLLQSLLHLGLTLVVAPITHDGHGQLLNTNADTIAQELATSLGRSYETSLVYSFEKAGVLLDAADDSTVIPRLTPASFRQLRETGAIYAGMLPKLQNAFIALDSGVRQVIIGKAESLSELIAGTAGTTLTHD
ncbi:MAG: Acetylglutamate kinase [Flaviaesturariibacter sp.]|nr:Acetylglutamate kinase [Flaviaesturariibacter sp.]